MKAIRKARDCLAGIVTAGSAAGLLGIGLLISGAATGGSAGDEPRVPLPDEVVRLAHELADARIVLEEDDVSPPQSVPDPNAPVMVLRGARDDVLSLLKTADYPSQRSLRGAARDVERAWQTFAAGSPKLEHLARTSLAIGKAQAKLHAAWRVGKASQRIRIAALQTKLTRVSERVAKTMLRRAETAGVEASRLTDARKQLRRGRLAAESSNHVVAVAHFGGALGLAANTVTFDVALFEQNIKDTLAGQTVGHAFSIAYLGQLYQGGESSGLARTGADAPETDQHPGKEMHVASVSKTLTAILVQRLLEENGLTPESLVAPYLPSDWSLGVGVEAQTFKDFMKHESGFAQKGAKNSYENLRSAIAMDVGSTTFLYSNANFGLMRVLIAGLLGINAPDFAQFFEPDALTAAVFLIYANSVYNSIDVEVDCKPNDDTPTVQYNFPDGGSPGYVEPNRQLACGGIGWFISSNELAAVLTHLRNTQTLLSAQARAMMQTDFLGYMDPANYGDVGGDFGVYYMHGGDWNHGAGELHACVVAFPIQVEVALVINSERGAIPYQCWLLQDAFDDAWVSN